MCVFCVCVCTRAHARIYIKINKRLYSCIKISLYNYMRFHYSQQRCVMGSKRLYKQDSRICIFKVATIKWNFYGTFQAFQISYDPIIWHQEIKLLIFSIGHGNMSKTPKVLLWNFRKFSVTCGLSRDRRSLGTLHFIYFSGFKILFDYYRSLSFYMHWRTERISDEFYKCWKA